MKWPAIILAVTIVVALGYHLFIADYDEVIVNDNSVTTLVNPVDLRADEIMASEEFQKEIRLLAVARAALELSLETQDEAIRLSTQAKETYDLAQALESAWHDKKRVVE